MDLLYSIRNEVLYKNFVFGLRIIQIYRFLLKMDRWRLIVLSGSKKRDIKSILSLFKYIYIHIYIYIYIYKHTYIYIIYLLAKCFMKCKRDPLIHVIKIQYQY